MPSDRFEARDAKVSVAGDSPKDPVWVDLLTGDAYAIPPERVRREGERTVFTVPAYDSPAFIAPKGLLSLEKSWYVRYLEEGEK